LQAYGDWMRLASIRALKLVTSRLLVASSGVLLTVFLCWLRAGIMAPW
jgi:hypothetical protein